MPYETTLKLVWLIVIAAYAIPRVAEYRLHRTNYGFLAAIGSEEYLPWLTRFYHALGWLLLPLVVLEAWFLQHTPTVASMLVATGLLFFGLMLRFWAIRSLGHFWTLKTLAIPGMDPVRSGPYRYLRHPEHVGRMIESLGLCLIFHAIFVAVAFFVVNTLIWRVLVHREDSIYASQEPRRPDNG